MFSPKREGAGKAYLWIDVGTSISNIKFDMSMCSDKENVNDTNTTIKLQYRTATGVWLTAKSFLISGLSKGRTNMIQYEYNLKEISGFNFGVRFITETNIPTGNSNKGRVVLDNIEINY